MLDDGRIGDAEAAAAFDLVATTLTVSAGAGGSVDVEATVGGGASDADVPGPSQGFAFNVEATATLTAVPDTGHAFSAWTGACEGQGAACVLDDGQVGDAEAAAAFGLIATTLTVSAGANGSVAVEATVDAVAGDAVTVDAANPSREFPFNVEATATLTAEPDTGYAFSAWTGACEGQGAACALDDVVGDAEAAAAFVVLSTLTVTAGPGGSVDVEVDGAGVMEVGADSSQGFTVSVLSAVALTAVPAGSNVFAGWTGACAGAGAPCELAPTADASATATFGSVAMMLAVSAGAGGGVDVVIGQAATRTVGAGRESTYVVAAASPAALTARPDFGHRFVSWTLSGGLACEPDSAVCELAAGSLAAGATATATFGLRPAAAWVGPGSVAVSADGPTHTAVPYAPGAFLEWGGAPCDGSAELACDVSSAAAGDDLPAATFRPFRGRRQVAGLRAGLPRRGPGPFPGLLPGGHGRGLHAGHGP